MDDLTRERYPDRPARRERRAAPLPVPRETLPPADWGLVLERRRVLDEALRGAA